MVLNDRSTKFKIFLEIIIEEKLTTFPMVLYFFKLLFIFKTKSQTYYIVQVELKLAIFLQQPPKFLG